MVSSPISKNVKPVLIVAALAFFVFIGFTVGCSDGDDAKSSGRAGERSFSGTVPEFTRSDYLTGLQSPWDLAFETDGTAYYTEKCRGLSVRRTDGTVTRLFGAAGSSLEAADFFCSGQSGMAGVALDPDFADNRHLYVFMPSKLSTPATNRVVRLTVSAGRNSVSERVDLVTDISFKNAGNHWGEPGSHSGGRVRFSPDGFLFVTTGDNHNGVLPQDLTQLGGKVLRLQRDGTAAPGNQSPAGADARIFSYGHRNVQGLTFRPGTGVPYVAEHGPNHSDEITALKAGGNGGWDPKPDPGVFCEDNYCGYVSNKPSGQLTPMTDFAKFPDALKPVLVFADSAGLGPALFVTGERWKGWNGALMVGLMANKSLEVIQLQDDGQYSGSMTAEVPNARVRSLVQGPDENLYVVTDEGAIWKLTPQD